MSRKIKTRVFDPANYLKGDEDIAAYLAVVVEDGDSATLAAALGDEARARNIAQLARDTGLTREGIYKALSGEGNSSLDTVTKVMKAVGLKFNVEQINADA